MYYSQKDELDDSLNRTKKATYRFFKIGGAQTHLLSIVNNKMDIKQARKTLTKS